MDDGKPVGINRPVCRLGQEIIHQTQDRCGEEKSHCVVAIPPLHQCILDACIPAITFQKGNRQFNGIHNMQHGHRNPGGDVKPDGNINMAFPSFNDGTEHIDTENNPYQRDGDIDRPFQFRIFLTGSLAQQKCNCS